MLDVTRVAKSNLANHDCYFRSVSGQRIPAQPQSHCRKVSGDRIRRQHHRVVPETSENITKSRFVTCVRRKEGLSSYGHSASSAAWVAFTEATYPIIARSLGLPREKASWSRKRPILSAVIFIEPELTAMLNAVMQLPGRWIFVSGMRKWAV